MGASTDPPPSSGQPIVRNLAIGRQLWSGRQQVAMGIVARELYASENGDRWFLARDAQWGRVFVRHEANRRSGGHVQDIEIGEFLAENRRSPEHLALLRLIGTLVEDSDLAHHL
jgi:hypothetical protein